MLTEKQEAILDYIRSEQTRTGAPPRTRQIQRHFGWQDQTAANALLRALERKGHLSELDDTWTVNAREIQAHLELSVDGPLAQGLPSAGG